MTAQRARLRRSALAGLALIVVALHLAALDWLGTAFAPEAATRLPAPIYAVLLRPSPPPSPPPAAAHPRAVQRRPAAKPAQPTQQPTAVQASGGAAANEASVPAASGSAPLSPPSSAPAAASAPVASRQTASAASPPAPPASAAPPPVAAQPSPFPTSTKLSYALTGYWRGALHGSGALEWTVDGDRYDAVLSGHALIGFSYHSSGRIDGDWLAPQRYTERVFTREKTVMFDRANHIVQFSDGAQQPLQPHVQDSTSLFMQLASLLTNSPEAFRPGATLRFAVARPSGMTDWTFTIAGMDSVDTPLGPLLCWHVVRPAAQPNEIGAQIWLSPQLQNLPVQIRLQQSADSYLLFTLDRAQQASASRAR